MVHKSMQEGKEFIETLEVEFTKPDMLALTQVSMQGGEETATITGV